MFTHKQLKDQFLFILLFTQIPSSSSFRIFQAEDLLACLNCKKQSNPEQALWPLTWFLPMVEEEVNLILSQICIVKRTIWYTQKLSDLVNNLQMKGFCDNDNKPSFPNANSHLLVWKLVLSDLLIFFWALKFSQCRKIAHHSKKPQFRLLNFK